MLGRHASGVSGALCELWVCSQLGCLVAAVHCSRYATKARAGKVPVWEHSCREMGWAVVVCLTWNYFGCRHAGAGHAAAAAELADRRLCRAAA